MILDNVRRHLTRYYVLCWHGLSATREPVEVKFTESVPRLGCNNTTLHPSFYPYFSHYSISYTTLLTSHILPTQYTFPSHFTTPKNIFSTRIPPYKTPSHKVKYSKFFFNYFTQLMHMSGKPLVACS